MPAAETGPAVESFGHLPAETGNSTLGAGLQTRGFPVSADPQGQPELRPSDF